MKKRITLDTHELIPVPIKVVSTGELLPEDWIGKIFSSGESFHKSIDNLDSRINKPPVTYLANYCMEYVKEKKIPELTELKDGIFYSLIYFAEGHSISARPSDALAISLKMTIPIFASEELFDQAGIHIPEDEEDEVEKFIEFLDHINPDDFAQ